MGGENFVGLAVSAVIEGGHQDVPAMGRATVVAPATQAPAEKSKRSSFSFLSRRSQQSKSLSPRAALGRMSSAKSLFRMSSHGSLPSPEEEGPRVPPPFDVPPAPSLKAKDDADYVPGPLFAHKWEFDQKAFEAGRDLGDQEPRGRPDPTRRAVPLKGHHADYPVECLVFKGGGAKGAIYPGAVRALEDMGIMPHVKRFAGASAGAVTAALLAAGLSADQLYVELGSIDLSDLVLDQKKNIVAQMRDLPTKFGMNPGNKLYRHLGDLFDKYLGYADITFAQLYETYQVELAVAVTNMSRASVELLHVKTAPNYPIRKAVRMSMSLPVALRPCLDRNIREVLASDALRLRKQKKLDDELAGIEPAASLSSAECITEYYVDGGVLNNYPIDCFDGWYLSMAKEDKFFKKVIGTGGHANYVTRHDGLCKTTIGFRLTSAYEPDAMHARLGNDALELKVRETTAAALPDTKLANAYARERPQLTKVAQDRMKLDKNLRASMDWLKKVREAAQAQQKAKRKAAEAAGEPPPEASSTLDAVREGLADPPQALLEALQVSNLDEVVDALRKHHMDKVRLQLEAPASVAAVSGPSLKRVPTVSDLMNVIQAQPEVGDEIRAIYGRRDLDDEQKLIAIQKMVATHKALADQDQLPDVLSAVDEIEEMLELVAEDIMKRL